MLILRRWLCLINLRMIMKIYCPVDEKETNIKPDGTCEQCDSDLMPLLRLKRLPKSYFEEALKLINENRIEDAIEKLIIAVNLNNGFWEANFELGNIYAGKGLYDEAIAQYNKAIKFVPANNELIKAKEKTEEKIKQTQLLKDNQIRELKIFKKLVFVVPLIALFIGLSIIPISSQFKKEPVPQIVISEKAITTNLNEKAVLQRPPVPVQPTTQITLFQYTVKSGDCLELLAYRFYGKRQMWKQIYAVNEDKITNPNNITVGLVIGIPINLE